MTTIGIFVSNKNSSPYINKVLIHINDHSDIISLDLYYFNLFGFGLICLINIRENRRMDNPEKLATMDTRQTNKTKRDEQHGPHQKPGVNSDAYITI
jgi:hypothetical protein